MVVVVLVLAVALWALDRVLHLKGTWEDLGKGLTSSDAGQRRVADQALGYWLQSAVILALSLLVIVLVATGHLNVSFL